VGTYSLELSVTFGYW